MVGGRLIRSLVATGALVTVAALAPPGGAQEEPPPRLPRSATAEGTLTIDRRAHDACFVAVPPVLTANIRLTVDTVAGTVTGEITDGSGEGEYFAAGSCLGKENNEIFRASATFGGTVNGRVDPATGAITADAAMTVAAEGEHGYFPGMPEYEDHLKYGGGFVCGKIRDVLPTCVFPESVPEQKATLTGQLAPDGTVTAQFDWYTNYCAALTAQGTTWTRQGCPTTGAVALTTTNVVPPDNRDPEIESLAVNPASPTSDDVVVLTVKASDPDGDPLRYEWRVDGDVQSAAKTEVTWPRPRAGDHTVAVRVTDPYGGVAESELAVTVTEGVGDRDGDGVPDVDDACPDEFGLNEDGCPDFAVAVGCAPARPAPDDAVTCTVNVTGARPGEDLRFDWYFDGGSVQSGPQRTWTWAKAVEGPHDLSVDVLGENRSARADLGFEVVGGLVDAETAGFSIASLGCNSGITSDEVLACSATFQRSRDEVKALAVTWRIDGMVAKQDAVAGDVSAWSLDRPAPGDHTVQLTAVDPATNFAQAGSAPGNVRPGRNAAIPPLVQVTAAGATVLTVGGWLWLESLHRSEEAAERAAAEAAERAAEEARRADVPPWVFDERPLAQLWAAEAAEEAARRGMSADAWGWNPVTQTFVHRDLIVAELDEEHQRHLRDQWAQLNGVLAQNPNLAELAEFVRQQESNVWRGDRIDPDQMERLQRAVDRLGQAIAGYQRVPEYTWRRQLWDYLGDVSQSTAARMLLAMGTKGVSELVLEPWATHYRMVERTREGWSEKDVMHAAVNETILYAGTTVMFGAGIHGFGGAAVDAASEASRRLLRPAWDRALRQAAQRTLTAIDDALQVGNRPAGEAIQVLRNAWQQSRRGATNAWQAAADAARLANLRAVDPRLADAVDDLYRARQAGAGGPSGPPLSGIKQAPTLAFTGPEQRGLWSLTDDAFRLTPDEYAAAELLRTMPEAYRDAVRQGLVPTSVNQLVNHARDKALKHAMVRAYRAVDDSVRGGLQRVTVSGSGAHPTSLRASSGWTDFDATAVGGDQATRRFAAEFYRQIRRGAPEVGIPALSPRRIDATMFPGVRPGQPGGFQSPQLLRWVEVDSQLTGRTMTPTGRGNLLFGQQPDSVVQVAPSGEPGVWALRPAPRLTPAPPGSPAARAVIADVQRLIQHNNVPRPPTDVLDNLRVNGKYAVRSWKVQSVGSGEGTPPGIAVLERIKGDRHWVPSPDELREAAATFEQYTQTSARGLT